MHTIHQLIENWDETANEITNNIITLFCNEPISSFSKTLCSFSTMNDKKFKNHLKTHENENSVAHECIFCFRKFRSVSSANDHMRQVHEAPTLIKKLCELCGILYRNCSNKEHVCFD